MLVRRGARPLGPGAPAHDDEVGGEGHAVHGLRRVRGLRGERGDAADGALGPPDRLDVGLGLRRSDDGRGGPRGGRQRRAMQRGAARRQQVHLTHQVPHDLALLGVPSQQPPHARYNSARK